MNKEDVQYGDWFRYKYTEGGEEDGEIDYFYHDFRVNQIYFGMGIDDVSGEEGDIYSVEDIEPVPLTDEILIANGFESNPYSPGNGFHLLSLEVEVNIGDETFYQDCKLSRLNDGKTYRYSDYGDNVIMNIEYVHELQHALRLCGIEKEIQL